MLVFNDDAKKKTLCPPPGHQRRFTIYVILHIENGKVTSLVLNRVKRYRTEYQDD